MDIRDKMHSGELYCCSDESLMKEQAVCIDKQAIYNAKPHIYMKEREAMLKDMFAEVGKDCYIESPFHANWGKHTHLGNGVYANFHLTLVDDNDIYIGDYTMIGPNVTLVTASHPIHPGLREKQVQYNLPVRIGKNVWIGAGVIVLAGVTIGDNSVIGAGSVVTHDIPANVIAYGSPCRVARPIDENDMQYYDKTRKIDFD